MTAVPSLVFRAPAPGYTLVTTPPTCQVASTETRLLGWDMAAALAPGNTPGSPTVTLYDETLSVSAPSSLSGSASVEGSVVAQAVTALVAGHVYRVEVTCTQGSGDSAACSTEIACPW